LASNVVHVLDAMIEHNVISNGEMPRSYDSFEYTEARNCTFVDVPATKATE
jgi:hypothetical protein